MAGLVPKVPKVPKLGYGTSGPVSPETSLVSGLTGLTPKPGQKKNAKERKIDGQKSDAVGTRINHRSGPQQLLGPGRSTGPDSHSGRRLKLQREGGSQRPPR